MSDMRITPRAEWGARAPTNITPLPTAVAFTIHWEGVPIGAYTAAGAFERVRAIQRYHMDTNGWADIAYNFVVDRWGQVFEGRGWNVRSAANGTNEGNGGSIAACYLGGPGDPFTDDAKAAYRWLRARHVARGGTLDCWPHRHWTETACPGDEIAAFADSLRGTAPVLAPASKPTAPKPAIDQETEVSITIHTPVLRPDTYEGRSIWDFPLVPQHAQKGYRVMSNVALVLSPNNPADAPMTVQIHNVGLDGKSDPPQNVTVPAQGTVTVVGRTGRLSVVFDAAKPVTCQVREGWFPAE